MFTYQEYLLTILLALQWPPYTESFVSHATRIDRRLGLFSCGGEKSLTVAESSDSWPAELPSWATRGWNEGSETGTLHGPPWSIDIANDSPLWVQFVAMVLPEGSTDHVTPAAGYLAPKGGCDNLCNENERYADHCAFVADGSSGRGEASIPAEWLIIMTEEQRWKYRLKVAQGV